MVETTENTKFVIMTLPRSGSYHLTSLLDSAKDISCYGEIYKKRQVELPAKLLERIDLQVDSTEKRDLMGSDFFESVIANSPTQICGFKAFPVHLREAGQLQILADPSWKKVFLTRNGLHIFVSRMRARETGVYQYWGENKIDKATLNKPVSINIEELGAFLDWQKEVYSNWRRRDPNDGGKNCFFIDYVMLGDTPQMRNLLEFLGSNDSPENLQSKYVKQFRAPLLDGIENREELVEFLETREDMDQTDYGHSPIKAANT